MSTYRTIAADVSAEIEIKRSRFLGQVVRVEDEEHAREVIEAARKQHWDARHHCSAFILGPDAAVLRSNDDGEPAGTAGAPMLEVLRGAGISDVVAVVTRWFGGTLLGAGGLVRAYGDAVREALATAGTLRRELMTHHELVVDHATAGRLESELRQRGIEVLDASYTDHVTLTLGVPEGQTDSLTALTAELTGGDAAPRPVGSAWVDLREGIGPAANEPYSKTSPST